MTLAAAPLFTDIGAGPDGGAAYWLQTVDGVRIRIGVWAPDAPKGTVLIFCGRTEYVEKYGIPAQDLAERDYTSVAIDWRGQGLADRLLDDPNVGHVLDFPHYQDDVRAVLAAVETLDLPKPLYMIGHSMGGCIGLRALYEGLPVAAAAFTGPMWGIRMAPALRPVAWFLGRVMPVVGRGHTLPPGTVTDPYVLAAPFEDNMLTRDRAMWDMMHEQLKAHPELSLGGPSYIWLREALDETNALAARRAPDLPCICYLGDNERIVHTGRIEDRMASWPKGELVMVPNGEHEVMMEDAASRAKLFDGMTAFFAKAAG